jgi:hypothetical protein
MKRFQNTALFVLIFLAACGSIPGLGSTPTPSPEPTFTFTPAPTETQTPAPTATLDAAATLAAQQTQTASIVLDELESLLSDSEISHQDGQMAWQENEPITVSLSGPEVDRAEIDKKITAGNFILKSDVTWNASGIIICGVIFRSEPNIEQGRQYNFLFMRFSGLPAWSIEFHEFGRFKNSPSSVKYSSALNQGNGTTNQVILMVKDEQFTVYINGVRQGRYFDNSKQRTDGVFAFLGYQDSGKGSCKFENSWIWELK